jgi:hypothetical protein
MDLVAERTRALNRLHGLLRDLLPGGVAGKLSADRAARILRGIWPKEGASARLRRRLASGCCATKGRWIGRLPTSTGASKPRWKPRAPPSPKDLRRRTHTGREDHKDGGRGGALPNQSPLRLLRRHGAA